MSRCKGLDTRPGVSVCRVQGAPVPEPIAPMKSAMMVRAPMHMPPKAAAVGI